MGQGAGAAPRRNMQKRIKSDAAEKRAFEKAVAEGLFPIAGADEVGRGPLAGPVVCAAVILPDAPLLEGVDDSKKLSPARREELAVRIRETAIACTVYEVSEKIIDEINILQATRRGMREALVGLSVLPGIALTDGNMTLDIPFPQKSIVRGDGLSYSIGAASIVAKVYRDALMEKYASLYPGYGFERNKGYGTAEHIRAIKEHGLCPIHRRTFAEKFWDGKGKNWRKDT